MKILKIIHGYPQLYNAGSEVYSQSICNELNKKNSIFIFTREENLYEADHVIRHEKIEEIDFYFANKARDKDGYKHADLDAKFAYLLKEIKPDIAHIGHLNHLSTGLVYELKKQSIPIVFTLHDFWLMCPRGQFLQVNFGNSRFNQVCERQEDRKCAINCYNRYFSGQEIDRERDILYWQNWVNTRMQATKGIVEQVDLFIAPSKYLLNRFTNDFNVPKDKIIYLDYGFPTHYLSPIVDKNNTVFTFGYIGTHIPAKGINQLIEAFSTIKEKASLIIFGRDNGQSTQQLKKLASKSTNKIEFRGEYINKNLAKSVFSHVDCIVVPSIWVENSPLVIHEAQACHIPVITANIGGMAEYVKHLENGLLFTHRNVESLIEQMNFAINNPDLMRKMGKRGYFQEENGLVPTIKQHCEQLETIYQQGIQKNNAAA